MLVARYITLDEDNSAIATACLGQCIRNGFYNDLVEASHGMFWKPFTGKIGAAMNDDAQETKHVNGKRVIGCQSCSTAHCWWRRPCDHSVSKARLLRGEF